MDLRKSVLTKNSSEKSLLLNNSILSTSYDTADDSSDNSLYYSFSNDSIKSVESNIGNLTSTTDHEMDDKENTTVIENVMLVTNTIVLKVGNNEKNTSPADTPDLSDLSDENKKSYTSGAMMDVDDLNVRKEQEETNQMDIDDQDEVPVNSRDDISQNELVNENSSENGSLREQSSCFIEVQQLSKKCMESKNDSDNIAVNEVYDLTNTIDPNPVIVIDDDEPLADPNENLINPFILPIEIPDSPTPSVRQSIKRSSIISTQAHYYSPIIRRSTDKLAKVVKPVAARRTIFSAQPTQIKAPIPRPRTAPVAVSNDPQPSTSKDAISKRNVVNSIKISKEIQKPKNASSLPPFKSKTSVIKPSVIQKTLSKPGTNPPKSAVTTMRITPPTKTVQPKPTQSTTSDQVKITLEVPKPVKRKSSPRKAPSSTAATTSTRSSGENVPIPSKVPKLSQVTTQPCKYCGKRFKESAFVNHWADNCTVIPLQEKRKIIVQRERTEVVSKRRTIFLAPPPTFSKTKTSTTMNKSLNKSGVKITPKKSLKCHICGSIIEDAFSLAKHVLDHKFRRENEQREMKSSEN